jgi:hypothetical protein
MPAQSAALAQRQGTVGDDSSRLPPSRVKTTGAQDVERRRPARHAIPPRRQQRTAGCRARRLIGATRFAELLLRRACAALSSRNAHSAHVRVAPAARPSPRFFTSSAHAPKAVLQPKPPPWRPRLIEGEVVGVLHPAAGSRGPRSRDSLAAFSQRWARKEVTPAALASELAMTSFFAVTNLS